MSLPHAPFQALAAKQLPGKLSTEVNMKMKLSPAVNEKQFSRVEILSIDATMCRSIKR